MNSSSLHKFCVVAICCLICAASRGAQAQDLCSAALPVGTATGCGVVITITGTASAAMAAITLTGNGGTTVGNGNPYDSDDILVGVQNNSSASVNSITLTSNGNPGAFAFDNDGPCKTNAGDCFHNFPAGYKSTGYEGPNNTFTGISANKSTGTVSFTTPIAPGGVTWFALEGAPTAGTVQDQCSSALPLGSATGCGVLITINPGASGNSIVITYPGNGNPYDGDEDTLVGIQNNTTSPLSSITLTSSDSPLAFAFDGDGPCHFTNQQSNFDCFGPTGYEGPDNTFTNITPDFSMGTVLFNTAIAPGGSAWFALENEPQSVPIDPTNPASLAQSSVFNNAPNQHVEFDFDYRTAFEAQDLIIHAGTAPTVANQGISKATYRQMVAGTSLATTVCYGAPGEGVDALGNPLCAQQTLTCTDQANPVPAGDNCPQSSARNNYWAQIVDTTDTFNVPGFASTPTFMIVPGVTAPVLAMGSDTWSPGNCVLNGLVEALFPCPQSELTQFTMLATDPPPKSGGTGKTSNSRFIGACCAPIWQTIANIPLWSNTTTVNASFTSKPPSLESVQALFPQGLNGWVAAPNQSVTFGWEGFGQALDPTFPVNGDLTVNNQTPCQPTWPTSAPPPATASGSVTVPGEGAYELHFFSTGCDNQQELVFTPTLSLGSNWAAFRTKPFNVDQTAPQLSGFSLSVAPVNGAYSQNQPVQVTLTCTDPVHGGVASGIATCGPGSTNFGGQNTVTVTNVPVPTSTPGSYSFGATDVAGNSATEFSYNVVALSPADVDVIEVGPLLVKSGSSATFYIGAWNKGPAQASNVVVSSTLPAGETLVSANYALATCSWAGCTAPPAGAGACTPTPGGFACTVPTLPVIPKGARSFTGIVVKVVTTVTATSGTILKNTAIVKASNPNPDTDNVFTWPTKVQ